MEFRELKIMPHSPGHRTVEVIYSDHADPALATQQIRFRSVQNTEPRTSAAILHLAALAELGAWLTAETKRVNESND